MLVASLRFNLHEPGPLRRLSDAARAAPYGHPIDVEGYIRLGEYFRHRVPADSLIQPFSYRPLIPFAASLLPFRVETSINLINLLSLAVAIVLLDFLLLELGFVTRYRTVGCLMFSFSFPTFYYGAIGFLDPVVALMVILMGYMAIRGKHVAFLITLALSVLVKETNAAFSVLPALVNPGGERRAGTYARFGAYVLACVVLILFCRRLSPSGEASWFWNAGLGNVRDNLARLRTYFTFLITVGIPAPFALLAVTTGKAEQTLGRPLYRFLIGGCLISTVLYIASIVAGYADGRVIWVIYPFGIPLALTWFQRAVSPPTRSRLPSQNVIEIPVRTGAG